MRRYAIGRAPRSVVIYSTLLQVIWLNQRTGATGLEPATFGLGDRIALNQGTGLRALPAPRPAPARARPGERK
jgi:hypothetical protein